jgi:hypothetical protein
MMEFSQIDRRISDMKETIQTEHFSTMAKYVTPEGINHGEECVVCTDADGNGYIFTMINGEPKDIRHYAGWDDWFEELFEFNADGKIKITYMMSLPEFYEKLFRENGFAKAAQGVRKYMEERK